MLVLVKFGDRLAQFQAGWEEVTPDQRVLSIIKFGYKSEFKSVPPCVLSPNNFFKEDSHLLQALASLIEKSAIDEVTETQASEGSPPPRMSLVDKKCWGSQIHFTS